MDMGLAVNFIKVLDRRTKKAVGFAALVRGSEIERDIVDRFLDLGICIVKATESEFVQFDGDFVKKIDDAVLCTYVPMPD